MSFAGVLLVSFAVSVIIVVIAAYITRHVAVHSVYVRGDDGGVATLTGRGLMFTNDEAQVRCELRADGLYVYGPAVLLDPDEHGATAQRIASAPRVRLVVTSDGEAGLWLHRGLLMKDRPVDDDVAKEFTTVTHLQAVDARQPELFDRNAVTVRKVEQA